MAADAHPEPGRAAAADRPGALVERTAPWLLSAALHALLVLAGFLIVWSVTYLRDELGRAAIDPGETAQPAVSLAAADFLPADAPIVEEVVLPEAEMPRAEAPQSEIAAELLAPPTTATTNLTAAHVGEAGRARFAGTASAQANRIVYILDASGSMRLRFPIVVNELMRSLDRLGPKQQFLVVLFQNDEALVPGLVGSRPRLLEPTAEYFAGLARWLEEIVAQGTSNPLEALRTAARLRPDTIFLLSNNITGAGQYEISQAKLLEELDQLNPVVAATGQRAIVINAIQFLDADPLETMRHIAERHGRGESSYNFIGPGEVR